MVYMEGTLSYYKRVETQEHTMPAIDLTADELSVLKTLISFHSDDEPEAYYPAAPFESLKAKVESTKKSDDEVAAAIRPHSAH